ncbi:Subtilisin like protein protease, partial [human gut metagenome]
TTLSIPGTSKGVITTAYYNQDNNSTVVSSGRGYTRDGRIKPDVATGAVNALVTKPGGGIATASGSSVATSILAGCCALILQWAIVKKKITYFKLFFFPSSNNFFIRFIYYLHCFFSNIFF